MELVSANTKNYLFLTMSQFNQEDRLVRARVSMRRDQAFWQGGNSFLACESFRISSSPSQGGLYYKIISDDFYVGASAVSAEPDGDFAFLQAGYDSGGEDAERKVLGRAIGVAVQTAQANSQIVFDLHVGTGNPAENPNDPVIDPNKMVPSPVQDPATSLRSLEEIGANVFIGQQLQLQTAATAGPLIGTVASIGSSQQGVKGPGGGADGFFFPEMNNTAWSDDSLTALFNNSKVTETFIVKVPGSPATAEMIDVLETMLGRTCYIRPSLNNDGAPDYGNGVDEGWFRIDGPTGLVLEGVPDLYDNNGNLTYVVGWEEPLAVGSQVYIAKGGEIVHHKVTSYDAGWMSLVDDGIQLKVSLSMSDDVKTYIATAAQAAGQTWANWLKFRLAGTPASAGAAGLGKWVLSRLPTSVLGGMEIDRVLVTLSAALDPASANQIHANRKIDTIWYKPDTKIGGFSLERRPEVNQYIYTPNELFAFFNRTDSRLEHGMPYRLNTDENGGFEIKWSQTQTPTDGAQNGGTFNSFYISAPMLQGLGLNPYFQYEVETQPHDHPVWTYNLKRVKQNYWDHVWTAVDVSLVSGKLYDPANLTVHINPTLDAWDPTKAPVGGLKVADSDGNLYFVTNRFRKNLPTSTNTLVKIYPTVINDPAGTPILYFTGLPAACRMTNTQQVSIESFGTFSAINIVVPNLPFQPMLGTASDDRILASLRIPFEFGTDNATSGEVSTTTFSYYGDLLFNSDSSRSYLRITTDQQLYDCDVEARLIRRDGGMEVLYLPAQGQFQIKLRFLQTQ